MKETLWVVCVLILVGTISCGPIKPAKEYDCGTPSTTEQQCIQKGCVWLPNFPGPWCQFADSPHIPSIFSGFDITKYNDDQMTILKFTVIMFISLSILACVHENNKLFGIPVDYWIVATLFFLSWVSRYHDLEHPKEVTFDEYYFGYFANAYCTGEFLFDIHPPLAKMTHWFLGKFLGHECTFNFHEKGVFEKYTDTREYLHLRQVSAFFGSVVVPLGYLLARKLKFSIPISVMFSTMMLTDLLLLSETRLILTDSQLFFYTVLSVYSAYQLWQTEPGSFKRNLWTIIAGVACGCVFCIKFTALATVGWIVLISFVAYYPDYKPLSLVRCIVAASIGLVIFMIPFYFHFKLGIYAGEMDWNIDLEHQKLLIGHEHYDPNAVQPGFFEHLIYLIRRMLEQNAASLGDHPYASYWYEWVVAKGALLSYAEHDNEMDWHGHVFLVSNPFICYPILFAVALFIPVSLLLIRERRERPLTSEETYFVLHGWMFILGWIANLVPYALVARTTYSYHYLPGSLYGMMLLALVVDFLPQEYLSFFPDLSKKYLQPVRVYIAIIFILVFCWSYFYFSPFVYGFGISQTEFNSRSWLIKK